MEKNGSHKKGLAYRVIAACSFGTILEWYDFSIYAYLAPILAPLFFPHKDRLISIALAYSVFAIGFFVRPLGAILFGHFGDRIGRKKVLVYSMLLIAASTTSIGLLPTYAQIGKLAPILLIIFRILQGVTIGGEVIGAGSFVIESTHNARTGFATSLIFASSGVGMLLSSITVSIVTFFLAPSELSDWGWRLPFLLAAITGIVGYYLRKNISESPQYKRFQKSGRTLKFPLAAASKNFKMEMLLTPVLYILSAMFTYLIFVYMPVYASKTIGLPFSKTMLVNTAALTCMVILVPVFGYYSDIFCRRRILLIGSIALLLFTLPLYILIARGDLVDLIVAQSLLVLFGSAYQGAITKTVLEMFPIGVRCSAAGFGYNLTFSLFGGTAPMIAVYLITKLNTNLAPGLYMTLGAFISLIAVLKLNKTGKAIL